jgi:hypothetical protein
MAKKKNKKLDKKKTKKLLEKRNNNQQEEYKTDINKDIKNTPKEDKNKNNNNPTQNTPKKNKNNKELTQKTPKKNSVLGKYTETHMKITGVHVLTGLIAAALSSAFSLNYFGIKNDVLAVVIGLIILYITGQLSDKLFGKGEVTGIKSWFGDGILPFISMWILVWVIAYNYIGFPVS